MISSLAAMHQTHVQVDVAPNLDFVALDLIVGYPVFSKILMALMRRYPDCDPKVCVAGCESKSYCDPGYGAEWAEVANCPLNGRMMLFL